MYDLSLLRPKVFQYHNYLLKILSVIVAEYSVILVGVYTVGIKECELTRFR